ncbi:cytochrome c biogenesis CcdA family protein [Bartonella sp. DGB1]|uniref:cytochrome c biogenesis CcdA family protein n=1 Tax=Bartonella sp. DGB1 TaxID=3239807 RepID=UPI0035239571
MSVSISYICIVFLAGALSFLSPCVLPLVPPYLSYMAGISIDDYKNQKITSFSTKRRRLFFSSVFFVLGFTIIFTLLGLGATTISAFLRFWHSELAIIGGVIIILMGLNFLGLFSIALFSREARFQTNNISINYFGAFIMGLAFAFGWTPCIGPILSPILVLASSQNHILQGGLLLLIYSIGLGIPFILAGLFSGQFMIFLTKSRMHMNKIKKIIGILLIIAGVLFITGGMQNISFWILETFPNINSFG